jgi:hypothetical protein
MSEHPLLRDTPFRLRKIFKRGKQGVAGLFEDTRTNESIVFKFSQYVDYLMEHENVVATRITALGNPIFCRRVGSLIMNVNPDEKKGPFDACKSPIKKLVVLYEYIPGYSMSKIIRKKKDVPDSVIIANIKILIVSLYVAHEKTKFTHYDLHTSNVIMKPCDPDEVFVVNDGRGNTFALPTFGYIPVVIDYGFSYVDDIDDGPMWQSLAHTSVGFASCIADRWADTKLFLCSASAQLMRHRPSRMSRRLRRIVKKTFSKLDVDFDCGWDLGDDSSIGNQALDELHRVNKNKISSLFYKYDAYAVDLMTSLVKLPFGDFRESQEGLLSYHKKFLKQFSKVEDIVLSSHGRMRVLKLIVDSARPLLHEFDSAFGSNDDKDDKDDKDDARDAVAEVVAKFKLRVLSGVDEIAKHANLNSINFEKMLCSLVLFARAFDGFQHEHLDEYIMRKKKSYELLSVRNPIEVFGAIDLAISTTYTFSKETKLMWIDSFESPKKLSMTDEEAAAVNLKHTLAHGTLIASHVKRK